MSKCKVAAAFLVVVALAACSGSDKKPAAGTSGKNASAGSAASSSSSTESAGVPSLHVLAAQPTADLFAFDTSGTESVPGGAVPVTFMNGTTVAHEVRLIRIRDTDFNSFKASVLAQGGVIAASLGDLAYSSPTVAPGESSTGTATLTAGTYAMVCFLTASDGKTFAEHGMLTRVEVTPGGTPTGSGSSETSVSSAAGASAPSGSSSSSP